MKSHGFSTAESPVLSVQLHSLKFFAFVEFGTLEEADACMTLQNVDYCGYLLRFGRPKEYEPPVRVTTNPALAEAANSSDPLEAARARAASVQQKKKVIADCAELSAALADPNFVSPIAEDTQQKMYLGGLSASMTEETSC